MYLEFFGLREHPFRLTPDADYLFMSRAHARAKAYMDYTVLSRDGFVIVTGEIGSGKTTLVNKLLAELPDDVVVAKIFQTQLNEIEFLQAMLGEFGIESYSTSKTELLSHLNEFLIECYRQNLRVLLTIDEAQNLSDKVLEEVRLLSGLETDKDKLLSIILTGQPELAEVIDASHMEQLAQRVRLRFHLGTLSEYETREYMSHRVRVAGGDPAIFDASVVPTVFEYTGGTPRLINSLCDMALLTAFADERAYVDMDVMRAALQELGWVPFAQRAGQRARTAASAPASNGEAALEWGDADAVEEKVARLYEYVPRMSAGLMGKMQVIEERLRTLSDDLRRRT